MEQLHPKHRHVAIVIEHRAYVIHATEIEASTIAIVLRR